MTGNMSNQGRFTRHFRLAAIAQGYLRIKQDMSITPAQKAVVEAWLKRLAVLSQAKYLDDVSASAPKSNHVYWAGWFWQ